MFQTVKRKKPILFELKFYVGYYFLKGKVQANCYQIKKTEIVTKSHLYFSEYNKGGKLLSSRAAFGNEFVCGPH